MNNVTWGKIYFSLIKPLFYTVLTFGIFVSINADIKSSSLFEQLNRVERIFDKYKGLNLLTANLTNSKIDLTGFPFDNSLSLATDSNPDYVEDCNLDLLFILDASGTMTVAQITAIRNGTIGAINYLSNNYTGSVRVGLIEFGSSAVLRVPFTTVNSTNVTNVFTPALNLYQNGDAGEFTDYGSALQLAISSFSTPDMIMFVTDGLPNRDATIPQPVSAATALVSMEDKANQLKNAGTHIYAVSITVYSTATNYLEAITDGASSILYNGTNGSVADIVDIQTFSDYETEMIALTQVVTGCTTLSEECEIQDTYDSAANETFTGYFPNIAHYLGSLIGGGYFQISNGQFIEYANGTAIFSGRLNDYRNTNSDFDISLSLSGRTTNAPAGSPKNSLGANTSDWVYYTGMTGTLSGRGYFSGGVIQLSARGPAFQIGTGANVKQINEYGGSQWFNLAIQSQPTDSNHTLFVNNGNSYDINFRLNCCSLNITSVNPSNPDNCPNLNNGQIDILATGSNLEYSINGGSTYQSSSTFTDLSTGIYNIRVRNSGINCFIDYNSSISLNNPGCSENCSDGVDNDGDGLIDSDDPDCNNCAVSSIELIHYEINNCVDDENIAEYSPSYPNASSCNSINASNLYSSNGSEGCHSDANNGSGYALCVGSMTSCNPNDYDNSYAIAFDITINPSEVGKITQLTFLETAPIHYQWDDANSALNNYPTKFLLRVLKNNQTIFYADNNNTSQSGWDLETFDLSNDADFEITTSTTFTFELRAYCRVGVASSWASWDIDDIKIYGGCCSSTPEICDDGLDNDGDGDIDCDDSECGRPSISNVTPSNPNNCPNLNNGQISITASGSNLEYSINGGATYQSATIFSDLTAGNYHIQARNTVTGCIDDYGALVLANTITISAINDTLTSCPGMVLNGNVAFNDVCLNNCEYTITVQSNNGTVIIQNIGAFEYSPSNMLCGNDVFTYQLCNMVNNCCETATVTILVEDTTIPSLINVPADETISCDERLEQPPLVSAFDDCPAISIDVTEHSTQGEDGCSLYDYTLTRTWVATDACGNSTSDSQVVGIQDITAPDIFRIYTLPNGKKIVAGVMENVNQRWKTISFPIDFASTPLVFGQVVTDNENSAVTTRIRNISKAQFDLKLQEEESADNRHLRESVAWIAIEAGNQNNEFPLEARNVMVSDIWQTINFENSYASLPSFFANMQTTLDNDPSGIRFSNPTLNSIDIHIEEERSSDVNTNHSTEQVAFMGIEHGINLVNEKGEIFGETGSVSVNEQWTTIVTQHQYYNPIVIAGVPQNNEDDPGIVRVRNVTINSFDIRFQEWDYLDGNHASEFIPYLVMEGSLPLDASIICDTGTDSLELGIDWVAIDNCDVNISIDYSEHETYSGATTYINRTWSATDECGNSTALSQVVECQGVALRLKGCLQGALLENNGNNLMRDDLRRKGLIPLEEPYGNLFGFTHYGDGGGEKVDTSLLEINGANGIVDWVFIELRDKNDVNKIIATCSGLIQCDGDVINVSGSDTISFKNVINEDYFVSLRHRNHLGLVTLNTYTFSPSIIPFVDFTYQFTPVNGTNSLVEIDGQKALWAGDLNKDEKVIYQGPNNDIFYMFIEVVLDELNTNFLPNYITRGYTEKDINLDGSVIFQGPNNDRARLLFNTILMHPENDAKFSNFIIQVDTGG